MKLYCTRDTPDCIARDYCTFHLPFILYQRRRMVSMHVLWKAKCVFEVLEKVNKQPPGIEAFDPEEARFLRGSRNSETMIHCRRVSGALNAPKTGAQTRSDPCRFAKRQRQRGRKRGRKRGLSLEAEAAWIALNRPKDPTFRSNVSPMGSMTKRELVSKYRLFPPQSQFCNSGPNFY